MSGRRWTVLVVPQGAGTSREVQVSWMAMKALIGAVAVICIIFLSGVYSAVTTAVDLSRVGRLERHNASLEIELVRMQGEMVHLTDTLNAITKRDRSVRLLAGLQPNDPDVQQAGVGGPLGPRSASDQLLAETSVGKEAVSMRADLSSLIRRAHLLAGSYQQAVDTLRTQRDRLSRLPSVMPTVGFISSGYTMARMHPIHNRTLPHLGIDIPSEKGTPILAPADGRVVKVETQAGYGKMVTVDHGRGIRTRYAHASEILVERGQHIERGERLALVGRTGVATNYHVHYEVLVNGKQVDPRGFIFGEVIVD